MPISQSDALGPSRASLLHSRAIIVDGHCDSPYRMKRRGVHLDEHDTEAQLDLGTLKASGITASFFASYVPPYYANRGAAKFAFDLIDLIGSEVARHPDLLELATSPQQIRSAKQKGTIAILIGVEGGHAIEDSLDTLRELFRRGARYLTLTHVNSNNWADSSGDQPRHGGLTPFGREVVTTMNDLGMLVDISHVSDATFYHVLETTRTPLIASHSSCRALTSHPRNMTDAMLRDLAAGGGVCMINFFSAFVNQCVADALSHGQRRPGRNPAAGPSEELPDDRVDWAAYLEWYHSLGCPGAKLSDVIDHIVHAATVAGIDHVGIGSDFDGVPALPEGLVDAAALPAVTESLLARGFSDDDVEKVLGRNFLRVFEQVEKAASQTSGT